MARVKKRRRRLFSKEHLGNIPGIASLEATAATPALVTLTVYDADGYNEYEGTGPGILDTVLPKRSVTWIDVAGHDDLVFLKALGDRYGLHSLLLEDMARPHQRPKVETYETGRFMILRRFTSEGDLTGSQLAIFVTEGLVITVREREDAGFTALRERLQKGRGRVRQRGADYLVYTMVDTVVDHHFPLLESLSERIDDLEVEVSRDPQPVQMAAIHEAKRDIIAIRRSLWPLREAISTLERDPGTLITSETRTHLRDCHDHVLILSETLDSQREIVSGLTDLYLSAVSHRTNEVMKVLTVVGSIFMPLSFVAGLYGMNFDAAKSPWNMPELGFYWGYPLCIAFMACLALTLLGFFWRHGWLTPRPFIPSEKSDRVGSSDV